MKYDFIMFENLYSVENHYKDLGILARLLKKAGYSLAIVDAFKEEKLCQMDGVEHISIDIKCNPVFKTPQLYTKKNSSFRSLMLRIQKDIYLYKVIKKVKGYAPNVYLGSMTLATPIFFFNAFNNNTNYYMWALRSAHVLNWKKEKFGLYHLISKALYRNIHKTKNLKLIVSNELIKKEFEKIVGLESERLILRPERIINEKKLLPGKGENGKSLNLLFIGTLRPFKNVEFCLEALKRIDDKRITYTIAGRCKNDAVYNERIASLSADLPNVIRIDRYIPDDEYEQLMSNCDFLILCDKKQASCASNGTMTEALLHGKPIIAPDFNPFKNEVERYKIGYLYRYDDVESLCDILKKAFNNGSNCFMNSISSYQESFMENNVASELKKQIEKH